MAPPTIQQFAHVACIGALVAALAVFAPRSAAALTCIPLDADYYLSRYDLVFTGRAIAVDRIESMAPEGSPSWLIYTTKFAVETLWKGGVGDTVEVKSYGGD